MTHFTGDMDAFEIDTGWFFRRISIKVKEFVVEEIDKRSFDWMVNFIRAISRIFLSFRIYLYLYWLT